MSCKDDSNTSNVLEDVLHRFWYAKNPGCSQSWIIVPTRSIEFDMNNKMYKKDAGDTVGSSNNESCHINVQQ